FNLHNVKYDKKDTGTQIVGTIQQKETPPDYVSAVPVYALIADEKILIGTVLADGPETTFRLTAPLRTRKIVLDPYQTLLTAAKYATGVRAQDLRPEPQPTAWLCSLTGRNQRLEKTQDRMHEEDSPGRLRRHPAKSSGLQECQAHLARRRLRSPALALTP